MQFRLNPVTLITGAGSGIGAACAHDLARRSPGGLVLADREESALAVVADELDAAGVSPERVSTMAFDATDPERWAQAAEFVKTQYGRLDWAVINASAAHTSPVAESDLVDWRDAASTHLESAVVSLRALMPFIGKNTQGGSIVVTASAAAIKADPDASPAPKVGLLQLMRAAAKEGAAGNVRVNAIAPGGIETPMWSTLPWLHDLVRETGSERAAFDKVASMPTPLARYASAGDVTRLVIQLLTDESPITGATLVVDGGNSL